MRRGLINMSMYNNIRASMYKHVLLSCRRILPLLRLPHSRSRWTLLPLAGLTVSLPHHYPCEEGCCPSKSGQRADQSLESMYVYMCDVYCINTCMLKQIGVHIIIILLYTVFSQEKNSRHTKA